MKVISRVLATALPLVAAVALAVERPSQEERDAARAEAFAQADADGSGGLSAGEFDAFHDLMRARHAARAFDRIDSNGDGAVTLEELAAAPRHKRHCGRPPF
jgi:hypothetical protein